MTMLTLLLRADMDNVRAVFTALPHLVGRDQRFAYAMVGSLFAPFH